MKKRFVVIDFYDFREVLLETDHLVDAYNACIQRAKDTDGECDVDIYDRELSPDLPVFGIYGYDED